MAVKKQIAIIESMKVKFNGLLRIENEKLENLKKQEQKINKTYEITMTPLKNLIILMTIYPHDIKFFVGNIRLIQTGRHLYRPFLVIAV